MASPQPESSKSSTKSRGSGDDQQERGVGSGTSQSQRKPSITQPIVPPVTSPPTNPGLSASTANDRRTPSTLPGLSSTASSIRRKSSTLAPTASTTAPLRRGLSGRSSMIVVDEDGGQNELRPTVDPEQLEEIRKGIIMPGLGGPRAGATDGGGTTTAPSASSTAAEADVGKKADIDARVSRNTASSPSADTAAAGRASKPITATSPSTASSTAAPPPAMGTLRSISQSADLPPPPSRSRSQPTLKASMLKKRMAAPTSMAKAASAAKPSTGPKIGQGTPARATRYSLPVRAEKPSRTSKMTGKHVVLPSESQLAPLPDEDEDDEDEEESSSSEEESDVEVASRADDELAEDLDEEEREKAQEAARRRREEAQERLEEARKAKEARRQARKPKGAPGHPSSSTSTRFGTGSAAHTRAPPRVPKSTGPVFHTFERLAPAVRVHTPLPRLTSYAVASAIHLPSLIGFLRREHGVRPRIYDECVYVVYFKPLLPGFGRAEVRSAPEPRYGSPGAESRREREIVEREESGYVGSYFAATNKDDDDEAMDEQGYIIGGEGRGKEEDEEEQAERRRQHEKASAAGDITETETEREDGKNRGAFSETDGEKESERKSLDDESAPLLCSGGGGAANRSHSTASEDEGVSTPRALQPVKEFLPDDEGLNEALLEVEAANADLEEAQRSISSADLAGAQDLRDQQILLESGQSESATMPAMRSGSGSEREDDDEVRMYHRRNNLSNHGSESGTPSKSHRTANGGSGSGAGGGNGHRHKGHQWERDEQRALRRSKSSRRRARVVGPNMASHNHDCSANMLTSRSILEALQMAELVILPYGVLVMYNMSAAEERSIINDVIGSGSLRGGPSFKPDDEETEAFHFCYDPSVPAPRIFNDFFTFRASNHLLKLSLAHAIAQSTRLSVFEESMQQTLELTSHIPKELASTGELKLRRREALKLTGRLFKLRVDVNLTSNVLDTPELFWSEASLKALYDAIREYLEIDQRVENLNERLAVGNDLLEVIHDHLGSQSMNQITWIIIVLIVVACFVACGEIMARLILHGRNRSAENLLRKASAEQLLDAVAFLLSPSSVEGQVSSANGRLLLQG